ncbi:hypothetical protein [uncultured Actinomyces sp.]|uniref:hypothetical protein n=1 Tax=uncultured Actinomyces sp. TaxID=249061 RepID=UPI00263954F4|nr:hypothetical protein [uncultured Actinomyces sp.]
MNTENLVNKITKLNAEIAALTEARDALKAELCAQFNAGDKIQVGDTKVTFAVRKTINAAVVEALPAFKKLPKAVRESVYDKPKLNTKKLVTLDLPIDLSPATTVSDVYATFR